MKLGKLLKLLRRFESLDQAQLAAEIGVTASVISSIENGHKCDLSTFAKVLVWLSTPDTGKELLTKTPRVRKALQLPASLTAAPISSSIEVEQPIDIALSALAE